MRDKFSCYSAVKGDKTVVSQGHTHPGTRVPEEHDWACLEFVRAALVQLGY